MNNLLMTLIVSIFFSCGNSSQNIDTLNSEKTETIKSDFEIFSKKFKQVNLPYEVCHFCDGKFDDIGQIEPDFIAKFIFKENKDLIKKNAGNQFYYKRKLIINEQFFGLIYYKTSESVFEYVMMIFDENGNFKDELVVARLFGEFDTEREQSSLIDENGKVILKDLTLIPPKDGDEEQQKAKKTENYYQINATNGKILSLGQKSFDTVDIIVDEHGNLKEF